MADGIAVHVGLNRLDPNHYTGFRVNQRGRWDGSLRACEQDAIDLEAIARAEGFAASTLLAEAATADAVASAVGKAATSLGAGDMFVLTFSGYGGDVPDRNSDERFRERAWALYDRQMPEDELVSLLASFRANVRVVVIDDSSAPGTVRRDAFHADLGALLGAPIEDAVRQKALPPDVVADTYTANRTLYDGIQASFPSSDRAEIKAAVLTLTGFTGFQSGVEGPRNGLFTETLLRVWDSGRFRGSYGRFVKEIAALMPPTQIPSLMQRGSGKAFARQRPLTI